MASFSFLTTNTSLKAQSNPWKHVKIHKPGTRGQALTEIQEHYEDKGVSE